MERLTQRDEAGRAMLTKFGMQMYCTTQATADCFAKLEERLAAYEDTGLEPEEVDQIRRAAQTMMFPTVADFVRFAIQNFEDLQKYRKAESEGRLFMPLCKIGDSVWFVLQDVDEDGRWEVSVPEKITEVGASGFWVSGLRDDPDGMHMFTPWSALGSEAFLSREAAEAKLEEREDA